MIHDFLSLLQIQYADKIKARRAAGCLLRHVTPPLLLNDAVSHKKSRPSGAQHRVGLGCQLSLVVNTWLTTSTPSSASQDLFSLASYTNVRRGQIYRKD